MEPQQRPGGAFGEERVTRAAIVCAPMRLSDYLLGIGDPCYYYPALARIVGGCKAAILLSRLIQWHGHQADPEGGIYKTEAELCAETGMTTEEAKGARRTLRDLHILREDYHRLDHRLYRYLDLPRLNELWEAAHPGETPIDTQAQPRFQPRQPHSGKPTLGNVENPLSGKPKSRSGDRGKPALATAEKPLSIREQIDSKLTAAATPAPAAAILQQWPDLDAALAHREAQRRPEYVAAMLRRGTAEGWNVAYLAAALRGDYAHEPPKRTRRAAPKPADTPGTAHARPASREQADRDRDFIRAEIARTTALAGAAP